jgi:tryptophan synthase alpha chain
MSTERYRRMFAALAAEDRGALVPFLVLGDHSLADSLADAEALVRGGADALELGIPFSDPIADGPTIQAAAVRALAGGATPGACCELIAALRAAYPALPIGLLVYANLIDPTRPDRFYALAARCGVDSVLVADVPVAEAGPYGIAARAHDIAPVLIAPPGACPEQLAAIAATSRGYTYVVARPGVTGAGDHLDDSVPRIIARLRELGAAPPVIGFGISRPAHVRAALATGAAGAISGSAVVRLAARHATDRAARSAALTRFVGQLRAATAREPRSEQ